jgi:hypothetical protein
VTLNNPAAYASSAEFSLERLAPDAPEHRLALPWPCLQGAADAPCFRTCSTWSGCSPIHFANDPLMPALALEFCAAHSVSRHDLTWTASRPRLAEGGAL